jgi:hypothetical protein
MLRALPAETRGQPVAYKDTAGSDGLRPSVLNPFQADPFLIAGDENATDADPRSGGGRVEHRHSPQFLKTPLSHLNAASSDKGIVAAAQDGLRCWLTTTPTI